MGVSNILIISYHSSLNRGDQALLETNIRQLRLAFGDVTIRVTTQCPDEIYFKEAKDFEPLPSAWRLIGLSERRAFGEMLRYLQAEWFALIYRMGLRRMIPADWLSLFDAYQQADLIASVSSTHFYSTGKFGWPFPVKIFMANLAHTFKKPLIIMPQSIGPLRWGWEKAMLRSTFGRARLVLLRDQVSMRLAQSIRLPAEKVRFSPDPAFAYPPGDPQVALDLLKCYGFDPQQPAVGITLIPRHGRHVDVNMMAQYFRGVAGCLKRFHAETGAQVMLFNQVTGPTRFDDDHQAASRLLEQLQGCAWMHYLDEAPTADVLKACYGHLDLFLTTRMHSGIFSLDMRVPAIFINYGTKTRGMMEFLDLQQWVIDINQVNEDALFSLLMQAWRGREAYRQVLDEKMPEVTRQVLEAAQLIRDYVDKPA